MKVHIIKKLFFLFFMTTIMFCFYSCTDPLQDPSDLLDGTSDFSSSTPPNIPTDLSAKALSTTEIELIWKDNSNNETEFHIQRLNSSGTGWQTVGTPGSDSTTYTDSGLEPETDYHYHIRAANSAGNSEWSNEITKSTLSLGAPAAPSIPDLADDDDSGFSSTDNITSKTTGLTFSGTADTDSTISLFSDIDGYRGEIATTSGYWLIDVALTEGMHSITTVATKEGKSSASSEELSVVIDSTPPEIPSILKPMQGTNTGADLTPTFTWTSIFDSKNYELQASESSDFSNPDYNWNNLSGANYIPNTNIAVSTTQPVGTRYYLRVRAVDIAGNTSEWSNSEVLRYVNVGRFDKDFNGDGSSDAIVGASQNDEGGTKAGKTYIYYGGASMNNAVDVTMTGEFANALFGGSVSSAGDVNGDGCADVIVGAVYDDTGGYHYGSTYIYYGGASMNDIANVIITGESAYDYFGGSVSSAGDVNGDGYDDIIVGAYENDAGGYQNGTTYIYYGGPSMNNVADVIITGESAWDRFGFSVSSAGDVNGDEYDDIIVGAHGSDAGGTDAGKTYIYYGGTSMNNVADVIITGESAGDCFGVSASSAGDVNGDEYDDIIVGAHRNDAGGTDSGKAYIYYGGPLMNNVADVIMTGEAAGDCFGRSVSSAGDVNGDDYDDIIVGADCNDDGGSYAGKAYIYYGGPSMNNAVDVTMTAEAAYDFFGDSVSSAGDVNGDGYADVIVGAYKNDDGGTDAGRAYIYYGGSFMNNVTDVLMTGEAENDQFGCSVE